MFARLSESVRNAAVSDVFSRGGGGPGPRQGICMPAVPGAPGLAVLASGFSAGSVPVSGRAVVRPGFALAPPLVPESLAAGRFGAAATVPGVPAAAAPRFSTPAPPSHAAAAPRLDAGAALRLPGEGCVFSARRPSFALEAPGLAAGRAEAVAARMVHDGLMDGSLNPRNPEWRPRLAWMLDRPETRDPDAVFALILAGCAGNADPARIALAQRWAREHEQGRFSGVVDLFAARHFFFASNYPEAIRRAGLVASGHPDWAVKAMLLAALSEANRGQPRNASAILQDALARYPDSPDIPEARYMEAWLALQDWRNEEAIALLKAIVADHPGTPTATKAAQTLSNLGAP